tara:strand:- start:11478 stop:12338 length:861 start_codon:yes stop_codon:yes gene_type:complete
MNFDLFTKEISFNLDYLDKVFPGTQPVSLDYTNIDNLDADYVVSLKYDGIRKMLYSKSNKSFLFDRKYNYESTDIFCTEGLTILDGEEINGTYIIFDCPVINGENVRTKTLFERLSSLKQCIEAQDVVRNLNIKQFFNLRDFDEVTQIKDLPYDGYIFTNKNNKYKAGRDETLYKYKDGKNNTIDFACYNKGNGIYELYCGSLGIDKIWIGYACNKHNLTIAEHRKTIVECYWDDGNGWVLQKIRHDKTTSNDIKIVRWNIRTIENNINFHDLTSLIRNRFQHKVS